LRRPQRHRPGQAPGDARRGTDRSRQGPDRVPRRSVRGRALPGRPSDGATTVTEPTTPSGRGLVRWLMTYGPVDPQDPDAVARSVVEIERQARLPAYSPDPGEEV